MAREATARLYDVDQSTVDLKRLTQTGEYDQGTIAFRADEGKFVDLEQLYESLWATRLSGGTRSGILKFEVTVVGEVSNDGDKLMLKVPGYETSFLLLEDAELKEDAEKASVFQELTQAIDRGDRITTVTGRLEGWKGRWPAVLREKPAKEMRLFVNSIEPAK